MVNHYIPNRGDVVWMSFDPEKGHEQKGRRPALIISPASYNEKTHLCLLLPITSKVKGYPFEIPLSTQELNGVVLSDQIKSLDWTQRNTTFIGKMPKAFLERVLHRSNLLLRIV